MRKVQCGTLVTQEITGGKREGDISSQGQCLKMERKEEKAVAVAAGIEVNQIENGGLVR